jgi:hypothetical protein
VPKELLIDVSEDEAPKPFEEVTKLLTTMADGEYVRVLHRKKPIPLIQLLQENGFECKIIPGQSTTWEIIIWKKLDLTVNDFCSSTF